MLSTDSEGGDGPGNNDCAEPEFAGGEAFADGGQDEEECGREAWTDAEFAGGDRILIVWQRGCLVRLVGLDLVGLAFAGLDEEVGPGLSCWFLRRGVG
jgi:hypothetical protein